MFGRENTSSPFGATDERPSGLQRRMVLKAGLGAAAATAFGALTPAFGSTLPQARTGELQEYKVVWSDQQLEGLRRKIKAFKFPRAIPGSGWKYGIDPEYLRALINYWRDGFDMEGAARNLNRYPQYVTRVEDLDIQSSASSARAVRTRRDFRCSAPTAGPDRRSNFGM